MNAFYDLSLKKKTAAAEALARRRGTTLRAVSSIGQPGVRQGTYFKPISMG
jgi:hypothetical protein